MDLEPLYRSDGTMAIQRLLCTEPLDLPMMALSTIAEGWVLALIAFAIAWKAYRDRRDALRAMLRFLAALVVAGLVGTVLKRSFNSPRPLQLLGPEQVRVLLEPLRQMSFPSGHSAAASALASWAWRQPAPAGRRLWPWLLAFLCGLSRVYVGAHWVTDVVGGWTLGVASVLAVELAWTRWKTRGAAPAGGGTGAAAGETRP